MSTPYRPPLPPMRPSGTYRHGVEGEYNFFPEGFAGVDPSVLTVGGGVDPSVLTAGGGVQARLPRRRGDGGGNAPADEGQESNIGLGHTRGDLSVDLGPLGDIGIADMVGAVAPGIGTAAAVADAVSAATGLSGVVGAGSMAPAVGSSDFSETVGLGKADAASAASAASPNPVGPEHGISGSNSSGTASAASPGPVGSESGTSSGPNTTGPNDSDSTGSGEAGGDSKMICTELVRQGLLDRRDLIVQFEFVRRTGSPAHMAGYHLWARPIVRRLRQGKGLKFWLWMAKARARDVRWRMNSGPFSLPGRLINTIGEPLCWCLGRLIATKTRMQRCWMFSS